MLTMQNEIVYMYLSRFSKVWLYPTGQKYSLELMFAKFATAKIVKDLNPKKISFNRL